MATLAKFGDELEIDASAESVRCSDGSTELTIIKLKLSATSPARSAFGLIAFTPEFFSRYRIVQPQDGRKVPAIKIQLAAKTLHNVLKSRSVAANAESCSISIIDPDLNGSTSTADVECRLVVKFTLKKQSARRRLTATHARRGQ